MVRNLEKALSARPHIAGESFTAADTQLGSGIYFATHILGVLPKKPVFDDYLARVTARPAYQRFWAKDAASTSG